MRVARAGGPRALPPAVRSATRIVAGVAAVQVCLGISTLLLYVPVGLGAAHQAGALALLTAALATLHSLKVAARAPVAAAVAAAPAGGTRAAAAAAACSLIMLRREHAEGAEN